MKTCEATASMIGRIRSRPVAGRGDVEEGEFVGALRVVARGDLDRVAASRSSTKLTPFTTRPPVTSRQGMMRLASMESVF
jgi:hypothetical protein